MGTLRIKGIIELNQFWPAGSSDADTTKIKLTVDTGSFEYRAAGQSAFKKTIVFEDAISKGQGTTPVINVRKSDGVRTITVRLQGVDAPELHYKASALKKSSGVSDTQRAAFNSNNKERRQHFAESATVALAKSLKPFAANGVVKATFYSEVNHPFEVVDTYGRFIGNIKIGAGRDINVWLVENGWCTPSFYTSMSNQEIETFLKAWKKGKKLKGRTSQSVAYEAAKFDWKLLYRDPKKETIPPFSIGDDKGKSIMPKIFRRQVAWVVSKKAKVVDATTGFKAFLQKKPDQLVLLKDLLDNGVSASPVFALHDFVNNKAVIQKKPEELVFQEKPGTLVNKNGKKIVDW